MIFEALNCIVEEMNDYFKAKLKINENKAVLSGILNQDGSVAVNGENKLIFTLINIENDKNAKGSLPGAGRSFSNNGNSQVFNINVLITAYFAGNNYEEALRFIAYAIAFLQDKNVFTPQNSPKMEAAIDKLILEIDNLSLDQMSNLWSSIGAKYMPSIVYKVRMLTFSTDIIREYKPSIRGIDTGM